MIVVTICARGRERETTLAKEGEGGRGGGGRREAGGGGGAIWICKRERERGETRDTN
jgi:hypothetical protein